MASDRKQAPRVTAALGLLLALGACAPSLRQFELKAPLAKDTDLQSFSLPCHKEPSKKDPRHVSCAPEVYVSPLAWDGIDNSVFRPLSRVFAVDPPGESPNANSVDEVADSAWFTNRIGAHPVSLEEFSRGACEPKVILDDEPEDGSWLVDEGKMNGSSPGFRVNIKGKGKYLFKADGDPPERSTAASVVGAAAYHAAGFFTSCEQIVYFKRSALKLKEGLRSADNTGVETAFDQKALDTILKNASKRGELIRMQASAWLPGHLIGPFRYEGTRKDDANDIIPHQDRRELRGGRLLAAWLEHHDAREQNSMDTWLADRKEPDDSSPGYVRHYYLDTSDCLGSDWAWDGITRRLGHSYLLDWGDISEDFVTLGVPRRPWDTMNRTPGRDKFGFFNVKDFYPDTWKNEYPNPAFSRMSERDGAWMARILARFTPELVATLAKLGEFTDTGDTAFLGEVLEGRLQRILERYLTRLSPIADVHVEGTSELCAVDLAERRGLRDAATFRYQAHLGDGRPLPVAKRAGGEREGGQICVTLPHVAPDGGPSDTARERYVGVTITDGVAAGRLVAWLYDHGPTRGYVLAGLERPEP